MEGNKYYVGKSKNPGNRIEQHISGNGSEWTRIHKPEEIVDTLVQNIDFTELAITLQYMKKYGVDNVRGATYSTTTLSSLQKAEIEMHIRGEYDQCFSCGDDDHFVTSCPNKRQSWFSKLFCCFRKKTATLDYTALEDNIDIVRFGKYKGCSYNEVWNKDKRYCNWVKNTNSTLPDFVRFKSWLISKVSGTVENPVDN